MNKLSRNQNGFGVIEALLILIIILLIGFVGYYVWHVNKTSSDTYTQATKSAEYSTTQSTKKSNTQKSTAVGTISGSLGYPSSTNVPQNVCAVNVGDKSDVTCISTVMAQDTYSINVDPGTYYVYSSLKEARGEFTKDYKAYYNEYSKCGNSANCSAEGHSQYIKVTVIAQKAVDGIDPTDWYNN
jgi:uncharacterized protein (UPF0333 family)